MKNRRMLVRIAAGAMLGKTGSKIGGKTLGITLLWVAPLLAGVAWVGVSAQTPVRVRIDRWLLLQSLSGTVVRDRPSGSQPAQVGDKLQSVGDGITTGKQSSAVLEVDTGVGLITVAERTKVKITDLSMAPDNGRITRLAVTGGRVQLKLRRFTHAGSRLEIQTPAGVSGVRGTEFGLAVQPDGKMAVAVSAGKVATAAQGVAIGVPAGFQNLTIPGEAPSPPVPLRNDTSLQYDFERVIKNGVRLVRLQGQVDFVNTVTLNGVPQVLDRTGRFTSKLLAVPTNLQFQVVVTTPLGQEKTYDVALR